MLRIMVGIWLLLAVGCESTECQKMHACCTEVADNEWVGDACGPMLENVNTARACQAVTDAIVVAAEDRKQPVPTACR